MSHASANKATYERRLSDMLKWGLGPEICGLLDDPTVIEIMLNPDGCLWIERLGCQMERFGRMDAIQAESLMGNIASQINEKINAQNPILECELPLDGSRFAGLLPPVVTSPAFAIRKKAVSVFTLDDYVKQGIMSDSLLIKPRSIRKAGTLDNKVSHRSAIEQAVVNKDDILIAGGTGSGKTTLTNAIIKHIVDVCPNDRLLVLEDTRELQCTAENHVSMRAVEQANMTRLLKVAMRMRPDRIMVGEVRDGAALALLKAWNTGHPGGVATLHANSALEGLMRLEDLADEATQGKGSKQRLIGSAVDLIIFIEKFQGSRLISEIVRVDGYDGQKYQTSLIGGNNV